VQSAEQELKGCLQSRRLRELGFAALIGLFLATAFGADAPTETSDQAAELAKKLQNPVAALISVPLQAARVAGEAGQGPRLLGRL
jgi:hypothetical protein